MAWWLRDPWRGKGLRERRRLSKLGTSERHIDDPHDAQLVHQGFEYMGWFLGSWGGKFIFRVGPWIVFPSLAVSIVVWAVRTDWFRFVETLVFFALYTWAVISLQRRRRRSYETARINGWR